MLGADYRGLGIVRSLGRRGIPVWVVEREGQGPGLAHHSRYAAGSARLSDGSESEVVADLVELAGRRRLDGWVLFPTADETAALVSRHHDELAASYRLTTPRWKTLRWAYDKRLSNRLADELGVPFPLTWYPGTADAAASLSLDFPVIVKPAVKEGFNRLTAAKAWRADDAAELRARFADAATLVDPAVLMVQEVVPGGGEHQFSFAALCREGRPLATVVARRTRQYPADFGRASTYVETVERPEVVRPSLELLARMRFTGLVEVEYKRDPRDGTFKLLDINPRVWGWHTLCARAGVDFPYLAWRMSTRRSVVEARGAPGCRWVRMSTDLPTCVREIAHGRLGLPAYVRSLLGPRETAVYAGDDPVPGLLEVPQMAELLLRRLARREGV